MKQALIFTLAICAGLLFGHVLNYLRGKNGK